MTEKTVDTLPLCYARPFPNGLYIHVSDGETTIVGRMSLGQMVNLQRSLTERIADIAGKAT